MSPLQIIKMVGFATGAALHLYLAWLIWNRRLGSQKKLAQPERSFIVIGLCLGAWFLGNLFTTLHELLFGLNRYTGMLRLWDGITMMGVSLVPSAVLFSHIAFWSYLDNYRTLSPAKVRRIGWACYGLMFFMPYAIYRIATGTYRPFFIKLKFFLLPYSIWYLLALCASAVIAWAMQDKLDVHSVRERTFFKQLAVLLFITGVFEFIVVGVRSAGPNDILWVAYLILSLVPAVFIAYYVYRYKLVEVIIKDSLVYAAFAVLLIGFYTYVIRRIDPFLVDRFNLERTGLIEALLILGMFALAGPLMRLLDRAVRKLFTREIDLYRNVVKQVTTGAAGIVDLSSLIHYIEDTIRRGLDLGSVRIVLVDHLPEGSREKRLARSLSERELDMLEADEELAALEMTAAYALKRDGNLIGLLLIDADPRTLTTDKGDVLNVLVAQVAIEIESCRLAEDKVRLERELAAQERLATLGQMAATVAHEVKNPLSAIKSIAQVMREEEGLAEYDRDLSLIVSEIDRLNRTVSQLLAFSRPSQADARPVELSDLLDATVTLFGNEARERGVALNMESSRDVTLSGAQAAAVREALSNLVLNAVQATDDNGKVTIQAGLQNQDGAQTLQAGSPSPTASQASLLVLSVTDTGAGIPKEAQAKIFEPFYTTKARGTGLGLAIVQRRIAELGGSIEISSPVADGRGTCFRLLVPLAPVEVET